MTNIYRILNPYEKMRFDFFGKIYSNDQFDGIAKVYCYGEETLLSYNLDEIISHIQYGNTTTSRWISCSTDLITDLEKYSVSKIYFKKYHRPDISLIRNHDKSSFIIKDFDKDIFEIIRKIPIEDLKSIEVKQAIDKIRNMKIQNIKKLVIDLSDRELLYKLFELGFIRTKTGSKPSLYSRAFNYARDSKEVLVLSEIDRNSKTNNEQYNLRRQNVNIPCTLSPIAYDVLYALIKNKSISNNPSDLTIAKIITYVKKFSIVMLAEKEISFYISHYICNHPLDTIIEFYNDSRLDVLSLHQELLKLKRTTLSKVIKFINEMTKEEYNYNDINLIDDNSLVLRSEGHYQNINAELLDGRSIEVPTIDEANSLFCDVDIQNNISSIVSCGDCNNFYTMYKGVLYKIPSYALEKSKKYIKKVGN